MLVDIDRDKAAALNVTPDQIRDTLYAAFGSRQVSTIYTATNDYEVILEVAPEFQRGPESLSSIYIRSGEGQLVPLDTLAVIRRVAGPLSVNHQSQLPAVTISFDLAPVCRWAKRSTR
jgi:HAE1 family hydrophobic/amphiphilic exporter-1